VRGRAPEVLVAQAVAVALEGEDLGVVDEPVDHGCGDVPEAQVWEIRDGKAAEVRAYLTRAEALKAVGLAQ
jgi:hypothetical protein